MRKSMRIIFLLAVLSMLGWVQHAKPELLSLAHWQTEKLDPEKVAMVAQAKVSRAFLLTPQWLHFPLEGHASELRLTQHRQCGRYCAGAPPTFGQSQPSLAATRWRWNYWMRKAKLCRTSATNNMRIYSKPNVPMASSVALRFICKKTSAP